MNNILSQNDIERIKNSIAKAYTSEEDDHIQQQEFHHMICNHIQRLFDTLNKNHNVVYTFTEHTEGLAIIHASDAKSIPQNEIILSGINKSLVEKPEIGFYTQKRRINSYKGPDQSWEIYQKIIHLGCGTKEEIDFIKNDCFLEPYWTSFPINQHSSGEEKIKIRNMIIKEVETIFEYILNSLGEKIQIPYLN